MLTERRELLGRDELGRLGDYVNERAVAHDGDRQRLTDRLAEHQLLQVLGPGDGGATCRDQQIPGPQAGPGRRPVRDHFSDPQAARAAEARAQICGQAKPAR